MTTIIYKMFIPNLIAWIQTIEIPFFQLEVS